MKRVLTCHGAPTKKSEMSFVAAIFEGRHIRRHGEYV